MSSAPGTALDPRVSESRYPSNFYAWYCVAILMGIYINSFLDRQILALLVDPIKADMRLSDTQMGFLMGPAFAIFYTIAGLPIGWLADRMSRRLLVGLGQVFWSLASISFGLSRSFGQMIGARIGVGVGEATLSPSAYSLVADLFPPNRLAFALSVYGMGIFIGGGLANLAGGYVLDFVKVDASYLLPLVGERTSWQIVFFIIAMPTIPLTLLLLSFREPTRIGAGSPLPISQFARYARSNLRTIALHNIGFAFLAFSGYGGAAWTPAFFHRIHGWEFAFIGKAMGWATILVGPVGILFGGWLGDRLTAAGYRDGKIRVGLLAALVWLPFGLLFPLMPSGFLAFLLFVPATFIGAMSWGVAPAAIQEITPNRMRGQASAVYLFVVNALGLTFGPQILALLTDYVFQDENQVHLSLLVTGAMAHVLAALCLALCLRPYRETRDFFDRWQAEHGAG